MLWWCRSVSKVNDAWFADEEQVRKTVGLLEKKVYENPDANEVRHDIVMAFKTGR